MNPRYSVSERVELQTRDVGNRVEATITREFYTRDRRERLVGRMIVVTFCDSCYLEEMYEGDMIPVIRNGGRESFTFDSFDPTGQSPPKYWGSLSYYKCLKISRRQTTFLGRLRNNLEYVLKRYPNQPHSPGK